MHNYIKLKFVYDIGSRGGGSSGSFCCFQQLNFDYGPSYLSDFTQGRGDCLVVSVIVSSFYDPSSNPAVVKSLLVPLMSNHRS